ncbi:hypothetical protein SASPL_117771 [Salvia splendens]|uniref:AP180 N-terminal homology (ANTH) domain-containing protein n=1 Tax=Salvia splendens TaxID=180675 RepID=A0A8X8XVK9_SALSN|nr:hypothetical protein SASPL_117771 [Salvia splendens]
MFNLLHFKDNSTPSARDCSSWIRTYSIYIEEYLKCFRVLKYNFYSDHTRIKNLDTPALLELPALQQLLLRLLSCKHIWSGYIQLHDSIFPFNGCAESVRLYVAMTDGVLILVDKFFEMQGGDAVPALAKFRCVFDIYSHLRSKSISRLFLQAQRLTDFFEMCRSLEFGQDQKYIKIEQPPASFLTAMEEYIRDAPQPIMLPWTSNDDGCVIPKLRAIPDPKKANSEEGSESSDQCKEEAAKPEKVAPPPPLIPDLLSWDEPSEEGPPESMAKPEESSNAKVDSQALTGWELAIATPQTIGSAPSTLCKGRHGEQIGPVQLIRNIGNKTSNECKWSFIPYT